ncbi:MAG: TIGR01777 family oxidoreductase [Anaerolineae bacterium]|nr:TIGR01777 family oxidoreductase [Anaerolineae bacterium]
MRVIITGGTGLIGQALTRSLMADGHEVVVLTRNPGKADNLPVGAKAIGWDGRTAEGWGHLANGAGAIVNLAGENLAAGRWTEARKQRIRDSRLNAGRAVAQAAQMAEPKPGVIIQSSAVGYYGPQGNTEITEQAPPGADFLAKLCVEWEASTAPVEDWGVRRAIIRSGAVLSLAAGALPPMVWQFKLFMGGRIGSGQQWLPWIHLADEVAAIRFLIDHDQATGVFNLTTPNPLSNADFVRVLGRIMARPAMLPVPAFLLKLLFGEMSTVLLTGQRAVPQRLQELGFRFQFPDAEAALRDLLV